MPNRYLLIKLNHYGIQGQFLKWIKSFLSHRTHYIIVEGHKSRTGRVTSSIPQGTDLGSTLLLVYTNNTGNIKSNNTSAFVYRNIRGCPTSIHTSYYKGLVCPIIEYSCPFGTHTSSLYQTPWRKFNNDQLELQDFSLTFSASALVSMLHLQTLKFHKTVCKATMMYKIMSGLVQCKSKEGTLTPTGHSTRGQPSKLHILHSRMDTNLHSFSPSAIRL